MLEKNKIGLARALVRRNSSPVFCAMVPQVMSMRDWILILFNYVTLPRQRRWKRADGANRLASISSFSRSQTTSGHLRSMKNSEVRWIYFILASPSYLVFYASLSLGGFQRGGERMGRQVANQERIL